MTNHRGHIKEGSKFRGRIEKLYNKFLTRSDRLRIQSHWIAEMA